MSNWNILRQAMINQTWSESIHTDKQKLKIINNLIWQCLLIQQGEARVNYTAYRLREVGPRTQRKKAKVDAYGLYNHYHNLLLAEAAYICFSIATSRITPPPLSALNLPPHHPLPSNLHPHPHLPDIIIIVVIISFIIITTILARRRTSRRGIPRILNRVGNRSSLINRLYTLVTNLSSTKLDRQQSTKSQHWKTQNRSTVIISNVNLLIKTTANKPNFETIILNNEEVTPLCHVTAGDYF